MRISQDSDQCVMDLPLLLFRYADVGLDARTPAPMAVLELMACKCVKTCKLPDCFCLTNNLKCMEMCKLQTCTNPREEKEDGVEDEVALTLDYDDDDD